jgi:predicted nucleotide-binding protein
MRIAIFGSSRTSIEVGGGITGPDEMEDFCFRLGSRLGQFPHTLLVETDTPSTADRLVVDGLLASSRVPGARVKVYYRNELHSVPPFAEEAGNSDKLFSFDSISEPRVTSVHLHMLREADLAIVVGGGSNSYAAGFAASLMRVRLLPVDVFGGAGRMLWQQLRYQFGSPVMKLPSRHAWEHLAGSSQLALDAIGLEIASLPKFMIVHGRSKDRLELQEVLTGQGIVNPLVLQENFKPGHTIPEKFEQEALQADAALVLFTPDDEAATLLTPTGEPVTAQDLRKRVRARQNVSLEYGWFWGRLGRERVMLLMKGELELPSDLSGLLYESYVHSVRECEDAIARFVAGIRNR